MGNSLYIDEDISQDLDKYGDMILRLGYSYMKIYMMLKIYYKKFYLN